MNELFIIILITVLAVISPGADFAVITKNTYMYGRKTGLYTATGIALGVLVHVAYTLIAVSFLMTYTPYLLTLIKLTGSIYLLYLGIKTFSQKTLTLQNNTNPLQPYAAMQIGFLTNVLNPKTTLFVMSTYTQIISLSTPKFILIGYGLFMSIAHFIWFGLVVLFFSTPALRHKMLANQYMINRVIGIVLCLLGFSLIFSNI